MLKGVKQEHMEQTHCIAHLLSTLAAASAAAADAEHAEGREAGANGTDPGPF